MGVKLGALDEYFDPGLSFHATGRDDVSREYKVPLPSAELGLWCVRASQLVRKGKDPSTMSPGELDEFLDEVGKLPPPPGDQSLTVHQRILGETHTALVADGVPHHFVDFAYRLAMVWIITGDEATTEAYFRAGGRPEAPSPANRQERRAAARGQTSTAAGNGTRTVASTSGTKSPRKSSASTPAKAAPRGRKSSATG